jgi:hypothetical protein
VKPKFSVSRYSPPNAATFLCSNSGRHQSLHASRVSELVIDSLRVSQLRAGA